VSLAERISRFEPGGRTAEAYRIEAEVLRRQNQELRDFIESTSIPFHWVNGKGVIQWANQAELDLLGYSKEEFVGHPIAEFHVNRERAEELLRRLARREAIKDFPARLKARTGAIKEVLIDSTGRWENDRFLHSECITRDITEQKAAQDASQFLAAIVESSDDAIIAKDLEGQITSWNQGAERLFGYRADEVLGQPISILIPTERKDEEPGILSRLRRGERIDHYETIRRRKDGSLVEISLTVSPVRTTDGRIIGASKIARDISQRKQAEAALSASEERFRTIADNIAQLAWTADKLGHATWYNRRWYDYTGTTFEVMKDRGWESVQHPDHVERVKAKLESTLQRGEPWEDTFPLRGRDGRHRWYLSRAVPIRDPAGNIRCWFGTNTDISELLETREALAKSHDDLENRVRERTASLEQAIAQMEEFSYSVSHDLRGPVRAMSGYAQAVLEDYGKQLDARGRDYLDRIIRGSSRMQRLIHDVLTYSRLARCEIQLQPVALQKLLPDIIQQYPEMQAPRAEISFREPLAPVIAHEASLTQAISNLLSNGVKFVAPRTTPKLQIWTQIRNGMTRLWIEDNGIGIQPQHQRRLFGMFERVHQDKTYDGTGIGLAIVRKAVERMGGCVGVESDGLTGSSFWIDLPTADTP
jgi:PAS domain S-box-containing protein